MSKTYLILNGPNLNRLGKREPEVYGSETLNDLEQQMYTLAKELKVEVDFYQSNHEGDLVDKIHSAADAGISGIVFNPAAYTHTSVALRDALAAVAIPTVEVHLSNVHQREEFRHHSYTVAVSKGVIAGLGFYGYKAALRYLVEEL